MRLFLPRSSNTLIPSFKTFVYAMKLISDARRLGSHQRVASVNWSGPESGGKFFVYGYQPSQVCRKATTWKPFARYGVSGQISACQPSYWTILKPCADSEGVRRAAFVVY